MRQYIPILILFAISLINAVALVGLSHLVSTFRPTPVKQTAYESGIQPLGDARQPFAVKYYLVAVLFLLFDVEVVFLFAWAAVFQRLGMFGYGAILIFLFVLIVGLIYEWKKGALDWD